ncbi:sorting nexin 13 [Cichlidogyrus casuarinus]|uniref:Sorting nexin 13 n=1 Tax=Cichlidogyrus casuarinus TaxID=1844966 RepID=A0ABD2Q1E2_9PLAT
MAVPDTLVDGLAKIMAPRRAQFELPTETSEEAINAPTVQTNSAKGLTRSASSKESSNNLLVLQKQDSVELRTLDQNEDNIPIRILFILADEVFDLQHKTQFVRRGFLNLLRGIVKAFFGGKVNKMVLQRVSWICSASQMAVYATKLRDNIWPCCASTPIDSTPSPHHSHASTSIPHNKQQSSQRTDQEKYRTRVLCRSALLSSLAEELSQFLGTETTRKGVLRVFLIFQDVALNKRLFYRVLESVLKLVFEGHQEFFDDFFRETLCPILSDRPCNIHTTSSKFVNI